MGTIIAIDGPSGVGKSTLAKTLAHRLGFLYLDSGAVYRAIARKALDTATALDDHGAIAQIARTASIRFEGTPDQLRIFLDGRDVTGAIRLPETSQASSIVATLPAVREAVVETLRRMADSHNVVMDGRDVGTKIFPAAQIKFFLEAAAHERARRRWREEIGRGQQVTMEEVKTELDERDRRDRERAATPLVKAEDAIGIDTSTMTREEVVERVLEIIKSRS